MKRRLLLLNALILILAVLAGWRLRNDWRSAKEREQITLWRQVKFPQPLPPPAQPIVPAVQAMTYADVAMKNLFSRDRNPNVVPPPPPPPPPEEKVPELPSVQGLFMIGEPKIILIEKANTPQRGYSAGDTIGPFKIVSFDQQSVVFDWKGKEIKSSLESLMTKTLTAQAVPAPAVGNANPQTIPPLVTGGVQSLDGGSTSKLNANSNGPGIDQGAGMRGCQAGDTSPNGAVVDGMRKVVTATPFGNSCVWQSAK